MNLSLTTCRKPCEPILILASGSSLLQDVNNFVAISAVLAVYFFIQSLDVLVRGGYQRFTGTNLAPDSRVFFVNNNFLHNIEPFLTEHV